MRFIRQSDVLDALREGPVHSLSELASRIADKGSMSSTDWEKLKSNLSGKLSRLRNSGYVELVGMGEKRRWRLKEE